MMRKWDEASKEEEKIAKTEGKSLQLESVQRGRDTLVSQVLTKENEPTKEKKKSKVVGCSTEKVEEKASKQEFTDTEDMVQRRNINQEEVGNMRISRRKWRKECWGSTKLR